MSYRDDDQRTKSSLLGQDRRSVIIMFFAAVILVVVIIAMAIQLVRLNQQGTGKETADSRSRQAAAVEQKSGDASGKGQKESSGDTKEKSAPAQKVETIRKELDADKPMVALTFDDGPYDKVTDRLVKILAENDSRATFFVVANRLSKYADSMKKAYEQGNQIATHTYDHGDLSKMKKVQIKRELNRAFRATRQVIGTEPTMLRPPYGNVNSRMRSVIGIPMICWNVDSKDWYSKNKKKILKECKVIRDGDIVLMHDLYPSTADAVKVLVPRLKKKGFQLVTVEEMFYYKGIDAKGGQVYYSGK